MEIYPATSLNTKHCVYNTISFSKITDITNTVTEMPNTVFGKWTCRPVTFVDFLQCNHFSPHCTRYVQNYMRTNRDRNKNKYIAQHIQMYQ